MGKFNVSYMIKSGLKPEKGENMKSNI